MKIYRWIILGVLVAGLGACVGRGGGSEPGSITGKVTAFSGTAVDSDVNDVLATYAENDSIDSAQLIANPVTVSGYVNVSRNGYGGRSYQDGDVSDFYQADMLAGQVITLLIGEDDSSVPDLDLFLYDASRVLRVQSVNLNDNETVTISATGLYYIEVRAESGGANYLLTMGLTPFSVTSTSVAAGDPANPALPIDASLIDGDFVPGEVIVEFNQPPVMASVNGSVSANINASVSASAGTGNSLQVSAVGMTVRAGAPGRSMLLAIDSAASGNNTFAALAIQPTGSNVPSAVVNDAQLQQKLDTLSVLQALRQRSDVRSARLNYIRRALRVPNDAQYGAQWNYPLINLPQAWDVTTGSPDVIVAVIDTGVLANHPDLQGKLVGGYDFISDAAVSGDGDGIDSNPEDVGGGSAGSNSFHGTHVTGIIAAATNNRMGVAGVAWDVRVMPLRVLGGPEGEGTDYDVEQAIRYAAGLSNDAETAQQTQDRVAAGLVADVINLSLGSATGSTEPPQAYVDARAAGVIVVAAAGNEPTGGLVSPAALDGVVSVSAVTIEGLRAYLYSNYGSTVDVAAPGGAIFVSSNSGFTQDGVLSTVGDDSGGSLEYTYGMYQGTSMAAPHVSGVVALMKSVYPGMTPDEFDQYLSALRLTTDAGEPGRDDLYGHGVIDAYKAVQTAAGAAIGVLPPVPSVVVVTPRTLNFSNDKNSLRIQVKNGGDDDGNLLNTLSNINVTSDTAGWLSVLPVNVDSEGLGTYDIVVDRTGLASVTNTYSANIFVNSSVNAVTLPVIMQLDNPAFANNVGHLFGNLYNINGNEAAIYALRISQPEKGIYRYQVDNVPPGYYKLRVGSDLNNDGYICGPGEATGDYAIFGSPEVITVNGSGRNISGTDFGSGYNLFDPGLFSADTLTSVVTGSDSGQGCRIN